MFTNIDEDDNDSSPTYILIGFFYSMATLLFSAMAFWIFAYLSTLVI
jgi:hypothetical protein